MKLVNNKLEVWHYPQFPCTPFKVPVKDEYEAYKIMTVLADQHNWLFEQNIIPDFSNNISVVMWEESEKDWVSYYNNVEDAEWEEIEGLITNPEQAQG